MASRNGTDKTNASHNESKAGGMHEKSHPLSNLYNMIMRPVQFNDIRFTIVDASNFSGRNILVSGNHMHPCYECIHVRKGLVFTYVNDRHLITSAGRCIVIPPGAIHSHYADDDDCQCYSIRLLLEKSPVENGNTVESMNCYDRITECLSTLLYDHPSRLMEMLEDLKGKPLYAKQAVLIHWLLAMCQDEAEPAQEMIYEKQAENIAEQVDLYLNRFFRNNITVEDIASSVNISYRHLARLYKNARGMTFAERLRTIRLDHAKQALISTSMPIKQIATEFGFSNEYYFATLFRKNTGLSPSEYRKQYKKNPR